MPILFDVGYFYLSPETQADTKKHTKGGRVIRVDTGNEMLVPNLDVDRDSLMAKLLNANDNVASTSRNNESSKVALSLNVNMGPTPQDPPASSPVITPFLSYFEESEFPCPKCEAILERGTLVCHICGVIILFPTSTSNWILSDIWSHS